MFAKNHVIIFRSFLNIRENAEWPRFLAHSVFVMPVYDTSLHTLFAYAPVDY